MKKSTQSAVAVKRKTKVPRIERACVIRPIWQALSVWHPVLFESRPAIKLVAAYIDGKPDRIDPTRRVFATSFLHRLSPCRTGAELIARIEPVLKQAGIESEWFGFSHGAHRARGVRLRFCEPLERAIRRIDRGELTGPLINMITGRPCKFRYGPTDEQYRQARRKQRIAACPNELRRERLENFAEPRSFARQVRSHELSARETADELKDPEARAAQHEALDRLARRPRYEPTEPDRPKRSHRIGTLPLSAEVRRALFPHDIEIDMRAAHLSILPRLVGAPLMDAFVRDCHGRDQNPWSVLTEQIEPGLGARAFRALRRQVKLLGQISIYGARWLKRPPVWYGEARVEALHDRLRRHPAMAELLGRIHETFRQCIRDGAVTLRDGTVLTLPEHLIGQYGSEDALHEVRSQFSAAADRYECEAMCALYRTLREDARRRGRAILWARFDSHDGCNVARDRYDRSHQRLLDRALRAGEDALARHGIAIRFEIAYDPRPWERELRAMERADAHHTKNTVAAGPTAHQLCLVAPGGRGAR